MTDITERLREHAAIHEAQVPFDNEQREWADDLRFAAAEIARLRARVAELETVEAAARVYYEHYMQDEAADEDYCICGLDQHERAKAVRDSLRKAKDGAPEHPAYTAPPAPPVDVDAAIDAAKEGA